MSFGGENPDVTIMLLAAGRRAHQVTGFRIAVAVEAHPTEQSTDMRTADYTEDTEMGSSAVMCNRVTK